MVVIRQKDPRMQCLESWWLVQFRRRRLIPAVLRLEGQWSNYLVLIRSSKAITHSKIRLSCTWKSGMNPQVRMRSEKNKLARWGFQAITSETVLKQNDLAIPSIFNWRHAVDSPHWALECRQTQHDKLDAMWFKHWRGTTARRTLRRNEVIACASDWLCDWSWALFYSFVYLACLVNSFHYLICLPLSR